MGRSEGQGLRRSGLIDVVALMGAHHDTGAKAALCMLSHGQVTLDGRTLGMDDRWLPREALAGRMLCSGHRCARVLGSALAQRALPVNASGRYPQIGESSATPGRSLRLQSQDEQLALI